jgi:heme/copper-type cytochrome/quinol oxidase subunit 2
MEKLKRMDVKNNRIKQGNMNTPAKFTNLNTETDAENLRHQYQELIEQHEKQGAEIKKNMLLTPFLLSIPVIIILFILISGSTSDIPNTITSEPLQHEVVSTQKNERLNAAVIETDSLLNASKVIALPAKK